VLLGQWGRRQIRCPTSLTLDAWGGLAEAWKGMRKLVHLRNRRRRRRRSSSREKRAWTRRHRGGRTTNNELLSHGVLALVQTTTNSEVWEERESFDRSWWCWTRCWNGIWEIVNQSHECEDWTTDHAVTAKGAEMLGSIVLVRRSSEEDGVWLHLTLETQTSPC
jgi:hypothetical protein